MSLWMHGGPHDGREIKQLLGDARWLHDDVYEVRQGGRYIGTFAFVQPPRKSSDMESPQKGAQP